MAFVNGHANVDENVEDDAAAGDGLVHPLDALMQRTRAAVATIDCIAWLYNDWQDQIENGLLDNDEFRIVTAARLRCLEGLACRRKIDVQPARVRELLWRTGSYNHNAWYDARSNDTGCILRAADFTETAKWKTDISWLNSVSTGREWSPYGPEGARAVISNVAAYGDRWQEHMGGILNRPDTEDVITAYFTLGARIHPTYFAGGLAMQDYFQEQKECWEVIRLALSNGKPTSLENECAAAYLNKIKLAREDGMNVI